MGWKASDTRPLAFEDCRVPDEQRMGEQGDGFRQFMLILDAGRVAISALNVGLAQACSMSRSATLASGGSSGRPISAFQAIQFKLADMAMEN